MTTLRLTVLSLAVLATSALTVQAQIDEGLPTRGTVNLTASTAQLKAGKTYSIVVEGKGFRPMIAVDPGSRDQAISDLPKSTKAEVFFTAKETREYKIFVSGVPLNEEVGLGEQPYTISIKETEFKVGLLMKKRIDIDPQDPPYAKRNNFPHKSFKLQMQVGITYEIMLNEVDQIDPYLFLEDSEGKVVAFDDDGGGGLNAKIVFTPAKNGEYKIICTTFSGGSGELELIVNAERGVRPGLRPGQGNNPFNPIPIDPFPIEPGIGIPVPPPPPIAPPAKVRPLPPGNLKPLPPIQIDPVRPGVAPPPPVRPLPAVPVQPRPIRERVDD
jgi:hypothetical protein